MSPIVCWEFGDANPDNPMQIVLKEIQDTNIVSCNLLAVKWLEGSLLCADLKQKNDTTVALTVSHSQDHPKTLAKAVAHGALFAATGKKHFTSDDMFCAVELPVRKEQIKILKKDKKEKAAGIALTSEAKNWKMVSIPLNSLAQN